MNRVFYALTLASILAAGPLRADEGQDTAAQIAKLATQRRDAARKTYEVWWANYREGRAPAEILYRWSYRWLQAERRVNPQPADQVAAYKAHFERMRDLDRVVRRLQRAGIITIDEVSSSEYYLSEAELWLVEAKEKSGKGRQ
jgi:hypothetical protein